MMLFSKIKVKEILLKAVLGDLAQKLLSPNYGGQHLRSILRLFSQGKLTNHF